MEKISYCVGTVKSLAPAWCKKVIRMERVITKTVTSTLTTLTYNNDCQGPPKYIDAIQGSINLS